MTREEAIARIKDHKIIHKMNEPRAIYISEALDMAIKALEQEPTAKIEESNFSQEQYLADIQSAYDCGKSVLDKVKDEIAEYGSIWVEYKITGRRDKDIEQLVSDVLSQAKKQVLDVIDKYKSESEDKE